RARVINDHGRVSDLPLDHARAARAHGITARGDRRPVGGEEEDPRDAPAHVEIEAAGYELGQGRVSVERSQLTVLAERGPRVLEGVVEAEPFAIVAGDSE